MICCKLSYTWWLLLIPDNHHLAAVWLCTYVWFVCGFGSACAQLTDGTVCNELLCDNYGACWGKWKKSADEFGTVCVCVWMRTRVVKECVPAQKGEYSTYRYFVCARTYQGCWVGVGVKMSAERWKRKLSFCLVFSFFFLQNHCTFPASHCCYRHTVFFYRCCIWMRKKTGNITLGMALNVISCW